MCLIVCLPTSQSLFQVLLTNGRSKCTNQSQLHWQSGEPWGFGASQNKHPSFATYPLWCCQLNLPKPQFSLSMGLSPCLSAIWRIKGGNPCKALWLVPDTCVGSKSKRYHPHYSYLLPGIDCDALFCKFLVTFKKHFPTQKTGIQTTQV